MMKLNNKKGFTLIELLAVIVILAILLAIAIPSVSKYINTAKKSTYIENVQEYATAARNELFLTNSDYELPVNNNYATIITFKALAQSVENGGKKSSYGAEFVEDYSYVVIVNDGTAEKPHYSYYIAALDEKGYAIGILDGSATAGVIKYDELKEANVVQVGANNGVKYENAGTKLGVTVSKTYNSSSSAANPAANPSNGG